MVNKNVNDAGVQSKRRVQYKHSTISKGLEGN